MPMLSERVHQAFDALDRWMCDLPHEPTCPTNYVAGADCVCIQAAGLDLLNRLFEAICSATRSA